MGPRPVVDLEAYIPADDVEAYRLERRLLDAGVPAGSCLKIVTALERLRDTGDDGLWTSDRSVYRRQLLKVMPPEKVGRRNRDMVG